MEQKVDFRSINADEVDQWLDLVADSFRAKGTPREYFKAHFDNDPHPESLQHIFVSVNENGEFVSAIRVFVREIYIQGQIVKTGCIGDVCTHPLHQGKGYASKLMRFVVETMKQRQFVLGALHSTSAAAFYEKLGWRKVPRNFVQFELDSQQLTSHQTMGVCELDVTSLSETNFQELSRLYHTFNAQFNGPIVRLNLSYWMLWFRMHAVQSNARLYVALSSDHAWQGYLLATVDAEDPPTLVVHEFAAATMSANTAEVFLALLRSAMQGQGKENMRVECPQPVIHALQHTSPQLSVNVVEEQADLGYLYYSLQPGANSFSETLEQDPSSLALQHVFWNIDSF
eukprot:TRINITY_DN7132_c0_g7_i1.p1 TRINITY_DN7132_c0_g7~~TRINITY_DN7132_c0_g7_i1.p1  ORF type:complete len:342 (-),score=18.00 TRINITY_DN7132_c0_g7_i1:160-1185(-)